VKRGTSYVLGAFLLIEDRLEHVRRLKNRVSDLRRTGDYVAASQHFEWAVAINPQCTTCLKDWAEILFQQKQFDAAETKFNMSIVESSHGRSGIFRRHSKSPTSRLWISRQGRQHGI
jgi:hypothetical protein